jgi:hypothetical protein
VKHGVDTPLCGKFQVIVDGRHCYVFTELSYLIALPDSLSLGLSFFHLISHPIHCARLVSPRNLIIRSCDVL